MKISCGVDIIEIERIKKNIENNKERFLNKIYTKNEIEYCESKKIQKYQHYAARFAAKEATLKALSDVIKDKYSVEWKDFEVINNDKGKPIINLKNIIKNNIKSIDISISHCKLYAIANVTVLYND